MIAYLVTLSAVSYECTTDHYSPSCNCYRIIAMFLIIVLCTVHVQSSPLPNLKMRNMKERFKGKRWFEDDNASNARTFICTYVKTPAIFTFFQTFCGTLFTDQDVQLIVLHANMYQFYHDFTFSIKIVEICSFLFVCFYRHFFL